MAAHKLCLCSNTSARGSALLGRAPAEYTLRSKTPNPAQRVADAPVLQDRLFTPALLGENFWPEETKNLKSYDKYDWRPLGSIQLKSGRELFDGGIEPVNIQQVQFLRGECLLSCKSLIERITEAMRLVSSYANPIY